MKNKKEKKDKKYLHYAFMLSASVADLLDPDSESEYKINGEELGEGDNLTQFFHALANTMPAMLYNRITGSDVNHLEFNHIANQLVFQFSKKAEDSE